MDSSRLSSTRLSSATKRCWPIWADITDHRPDPLGSVVEGETTADSARNAPESSSTPDLPPEGMWNGGKPEERWVENPEPDHPKKSETEERQTEPTDDGQTRRHRGRWLGLLGAISGLLVLAALSGHQHHGVPSHPGVSGVGMPTTLAGNAPVKPLRIALLLGNGFSATTHAREVGTLEAWLSGHVNPATRLTVIDGQRDTSTAALPPTRWSSDDKGRPFAGTLAEVLQNRLEVGRGQRVMVTVDHADPLPGQALARLRLVLREGAKLPASVPLEPDRTIWKAVDPSETQALAATTARAVISISNMTEGEGE